MPANTTAIIRSACGPGKRGWRGGSVRGPIADGAVVVTVTVILLPGATEFGETVQVDSEGAPVQVDPTPWLNPPSLPTVSVYVAVCPGDTVSEDGVPEATASVKSWPVPLSATVCGLPDALSAMVNVPARVPAKVGVKVTSIVQFAPALSETPHVLVCAKSPLVPMLLMVSEASPLSVKVTLCSALVEFTSCGVKVRVDGETLAAGEAVLGEIFATNPSKFPPGLDCKAFLVGKFVESVVPPTYTLPTESTATP
jgi:hypothetical protein